ncbi:MAG: hypothetical protein ABL879_13055, partial [Devosia sp.]
MADYKELLRRAVEALPENNGAARRAVYEKARAALVGQLRAINPPLPARDITTHRLQLEDCIRQVEQAASEAVIANIGQEPPPPPPSKPVAAISEAPVKKAASEAPATPAKAAFVPPKMPSAPQRSVTAPASKAETNRADAKPVAKSAAGAPKSDPASKPATADADSIEQIIAAAERDRPAPAAPTAPIQRTEPKRPPKSHPVLVAKNNPPPTPANDADQRPAARQQ